MKNRLIALLVLLFILLSTIIYFFTIGPLGKINKHRLFNQITNISSSDKELQDDLTTIFLVVGKKYKYPALPNIKFIFLDDKQTNPVLKDVFNDMESRQIMMANDEDYYPIMKKLNLDPAVTVFVDKNMLYLYSNMNIDPTNLTSREEIIGKVIFHEGEHIKQQKIVETSDVNLTLYDLYWQKNKPTPTNKLLEALADARLKLDTTPNYHGEEIKQAISDKNNQYKRLNQIYNLYTILMKKLDNKEEINKQDAQKLITMFEDLNKKPSSDELQLLRLN